MLTPERAEEVYRDLEGKAREELAAEGMADAHAQFLRELDLRYTGQGYELRTPLDGLYEDRLTPQSLLKARDRFDERHAQIHGHAAKEKPVEVVSYRLRVRVAVPKYQPVAEPPGTTRNAKDAGKGAREVFFDGKSATIAKLYERDKLDVGTELFGPAIVEQFDATTVIPPHWSARVDAYRNLVLERES